MRISSSSHASSGLALDTSLLKPGMRLGIGVSGGADSVALLRALHAQSRELGLVLHVAHLHHGLRDADADADLEFVRELAAELGLPFHKARVDVAAESRATAGKAAESIEEAARRMRYAWFRELLAKIPLDAIATAHTLDDQAESVLGKFLRGAWTEGLSGIHPRVKFPEGIIVRPLLAVRRAEIESYLHSLAQPWREDATNRDTVYTRNRIRHELLPELEKWNPKLREHLANMAGLAREEESFLSAEAARLTATMILPGRPVRGGGRASTGAEGLALEIGQLAAQPVAMQRRILRFAAGKLGAALDFQATEALRTLALSGTAGQRCELAGGLRAERSHRELRLAILAEAEAAPDAVSIPVPGEASSETFGLSVRITGASADSAMLRNWKPGDRVTLRHSSGPRKVKEVLERMKVTGAERALWPVLEWQGKIVWMQGVVVEAAAGIEVQVKPLR